MIPGRAGRGHRAIRTDLAVVWRNLLAMFSVMNRRPAYADEPKGGDYNETGRSSCRGDCRSRN